MAIRLTNKELETIRMRYKGLKNKEIAEALEVTESDVSQTLSRVANKIRSVQDTLELMRSIGIIKHDVEIELTESGQALLARLRRKWPSRVEDAKRLALVLPMKEAGIVNEQRLTGYAFGKELRERNVGKTLEEIAETLRALSSQVKSTDTREPLALEKASTKSIERKVRRSYIS